MISTTDKYTTHALPDKRITNKLSLSIHDAGHVILPRDILAKAHRR